MFWLVHGCSVYCLKPEEIIAAIILIYSISNTSWEHLLQTPGLKAVGVKILASGDCLKELPFPDHLDIFRWRKWAYCQRGHSDCNSGTCLWLQMTQLSLVWSRMVMSCWLQRVYFLEVLVIFYAVIINLCLCSFTTLCMVQPQNSKGHIATNIQVWRVNLLCSIQNLHGVGKLATGPKYYGHKLLRRLDQLYSFFPEALSDEHNGHVTVWSATLMSHKNMHFCTFIPVFSFLKKILAVHILTYTVCTYCSICFFLKIFDIYMRRMCETEVEFVVFCMTLCNKDNSASYAL